MELLAVLLGQLVFATPALAIYAVWRQRKLRQQLEDLTLRSSEQNDALHRELLELRRQLSAFPQANEKAQASEKKTPEHVASAVILKAPEPAPAAQPPEPVKPTPSQVPVSAKLTLPDKTQPAFCAWCGTVHAGGVSACPTAKPVERKPEAAPLAATPLPESARETTVAARSSVPAESVASAPSKSADGVPEEAKPTPRPVSPTTAPAEPVTPPRPPTAPAPPRVAPPPPPPPPAARVVAPPRVAALRSPAPTPAAQRRMKSVFDFEEILGKNWLNKIGITLVVIAAAYFGIRGFDELGPAGKVSLLYLSAVAVLVGGIFLEKRDRYRIISYAFIGGGWALLFFTTYALNHVAAMHLVSSLTADLVLLLAVALGMVVHTLRYRSQVVTGLAFLLAYWTVSLSQDDVYSLSAGVVLAIGLVSIVIKMGWFELEVFGILSGYLSHLYWLYRLLGPDGANGRTFPEYQASLAILLFYWLTYRVSYVVRKPKTPFEEHVSTAAALINTLLLLGTMKFQSVHPELAFWALLIIGAIEFSLAQLPITKRRREAFVVLSVLGAALMIASVPFRYSGNNVAILWLIGAEALLAAGVVAAEIVFRWLGLFAGLLVALHLFKSDLPQLIAARQTSENLMLAAGVMFALCAIVFYINALWVGHRWPEFFGDSPDSELLAIHSYIGGFAAAAAAWALCSGDWTVLAFSGIMLALALLEHRLKSGHLQLQYGVIGLLSLYRVLFFNLHTEIPQYTHVTTRLITLPIVATAFYFTARWAALRDEPTQRRLRGLFALAGTGLITALIYYEVPELLQPVAAIVFAVVLLEVGRALDYDALAWHAHLLTGLGVLAAVTADERGILRWHDIRIHAFGALPVVAGAYWMARRIRVSNESHNRIGRFAYSWAGTGLMVWVLNEAVPAPWIAVAWVLFAIALALILRRIKYNQLAWQANAVAACALVRTYTYDMQRGDLAWPGVSLRMVTIAIVAAGLYFLSRQATVPDSPSRRAVSYLHTFAATALLALLAWYEAPTGWLAAVWAVFALVLALVDRRFELEDLAWQAHALAALTMLRSVTVNLYVVETWHGISVRLLSLAIVTVVLYALSRIIRMPESWRAQEFHHIYSWAASALVALLMWYELQSLSVAVGWAVFGLVLFEYGLWRQTRQFRWQAYVALTASFGRIFFANLTAGEPGEFWGPRIYTVLPIALILFFVYAQIETDKSGQEDKRLRFDLILAYLGTGTIVALLYFQYPNDWLVTAWAIVVAALLGLALALDRPIFLHQGLLLTLGACTRGAMHNLFGASYFSGGDWTGRYFVLGSGIAILLGCLPIAFRLRDRYKTRPASNRIASLARRPEQFLFFAPVLLLTVMLALKMRAGMVTVAWGIEALAILIFAFVINERSYRLTGLLLLLASFGKILALDMWSGAWNWSDRIITLAIVGVAMVLASFLYAKYSEKIRQFL